MRLHRDRLDRLRLRRDLLWRVEADSLRRGRERRALRMLRMTERATLRDYRPDLCERDRLRARGGRRRRPDPDRDRSDPRRGRHRDPPQGLPGVAAVEVMADPRAET